MYVTLAWYTKREPHTETPHELRMSPGKYCGEVVATIFDTASATLLA
jgi:hypothetical protein